MGKQNHVICPHKEDANLILIFIRVKIFVLNIIFDMSHLVNRDELVKRERRVQTHTEKPQNFVNVFFLYSELD